MLHIDIFQSATLHALNRHQEATSLLLDALAFSEKEGYVRPFVNDAEKIAPVLLEIADALPEKAISPHLEKVFTDCNIPIRRPEKGNDSESNGYEALTKREIEILKWIAKGAKNKEIVQRESISISTVKTHVHRIINKLGVQTRTQAIIKAKKIEII